MQNLIVSATDNKITLVLASDEQFKKVSYPVSAEIVRGSEIVDTQAYSETLLQMIKEVTVKPDRRLSLNFLVEPEDVILKFVTVSKKNGASEEQLLNEIRSKINDAPLEDLYFSYQKIAPFVYQFVGMRKEKLDKYLEISNSLGIPLQSVVPWVQLLPKLTANGEPCIFVSQTNGKQAVALSELNGIYFCSTFNEEKSSDELEKLVAELSVYKRSSPITNIYTITSQNFSLNPSYQVTSLIPEGDEYKEIQGAEAHAILNKLMLEEPELVTSQANLVNLLPLPAEVKSNTSLIMVGTGIVTALLVGGVVLFTQFSGRAEQPTASVVPDNSAVLSEAANNTPIEEEPVLEMKKEDLKIRVENGAGVPGVAANAQELLEEKGYKVDEIGNAEEIGRADTLLSFKASKAAYKEILSEDLKDDYDVTSDEELSEESEYDVIIIIGLN